MKKTVSIFLSLLLLLSSSGIGYAQHFCGELEMMSKITVGHEILSCGMNQTATDCVADLVILESHDCCKNHITKISTDDNFAKARFNINLNNTFVAAFVSTFILKIIEVDQASTHFYANYNPPPIDKDIPIFYQSFLI